MVCGAWSALTIGHLPILSSLTFKYYCHNQTLPKATLKLNNVFFPVQPHWRQRSRLRPPRPSRGQVQGWKGRMWGLWWGSHNSRDDHHLMVGDGRSIGKKIKFYSISVNSNIDLQKLKEMKTEITTNHVKSSPLLGFHKQKPIPKRQL